MCLLFFAGISLGDEPGNVVSVQFENDYFGGGTDRHFTHGTRLECLTRPIKWITNGANKLPWFSTDEAAGNARDGLKGRASVSLGQNIYTPQDTYTTKVIPDDRPYAGWLYMGFGLVANQGSSRYDKVQLEVGIVGPSSMAEQVQTFWHSLFGLHIPEGWDNQLKNEPGLNLYYEQARRFYSHHDIFGLELDLVPNFGGCIGNVFTYGAAGATVRLGPDLKEDFGPPPIRPSLPGGVYFRSEKGINWYLFAGLEGRVVIRNIFLDGNSFRESPSVDKKPFVSDLQAGLTFQWNRLRLSYTQIFRTKEFNGQDSADVFGSLSISYQF